MLVTPLPQLRDTGGDSEIEKRPPLQAAPRLNCRPWRAFPLKVSSNGSLVFEVPVTA